LKLSKLVLKNLARRKGRSLFTILGVASALALLVLVESLSAGLDRAMSATDAARTLVVYRKNRYCPQTSFLPESYTRRIEDLAGVEGVLPVKVFLNNCRASLDLVTFHGAPVERVLEQRGIRMLDGDAQVFARERDAALVGKDFAARRGLDVGDRFRFGNIDVKVSGVFESEDSTNESVILTHLEFLQRAGPVDRLGTVTQFEVLAQEGTDVGALAKTIDELFATAQEPTDTRPRIAYLAGATTDLREILRFGKLLALACVVVVLALVGNTVLMSVQDRVRELGVMRALGFEERHIGALVLSEGVVLALTGAAIGVGGALTLLYTSHLSIGSEGVSVGFVVSPQLALRGLAVALATGALAGIVPALISARRGIVDSLGA
jgi:putative ABC transport system permease protein